MNRRMVIHTLGDIALAQAALLVLPALVSLIYPDELRVFWSFLVTICIAVVTGMLMRILSNPGTTVIFAKEGFVIVSYAWLMMSAIGALPFVLSGEIPSYVDAFFEMVSGFTTTGASILTNVEALSHGTLFWRSFSHWIGGMGVLVFVMALVPNISDRSIHLLRAEMPGPEVGKLKPKARDTAKILYIIYIVMTCVQIIMLLAGGMPLFDSVLHTFGTAGTGGFGIKSDSIGGYSPYLQWVITVFMLLFGVNFNLYYLLLIKKFKSVFKSTEIWVYFSIVLVSIVLIGFNVYNTYSSFSETLRMSAFQVSSIVTTTGYSTTDFNTWPVMSKTVLLLLMIVGACAGSTAGGLKVSRVVLLFKAVSREFKKMLHPRSVRVVKMEGKTVEEQTLSSVTVYFAIYMICTLFIFLMLSFEPFSIETNFSATLACFNNIGPGLGDVGPASSFAGYSAFSKILLSVAMLMGRLEIYPLILGLNPLVWRKR